MMLSLSQITLMHGRDQILGHANASNHPMLFGISAIPLSLLNSSFGLVQKLRTLDLISANIDSRVVARQGASLIRWSTSLMCVLGTANEHEEVWSLVSLLVPCSRICKFQIVPFFACAQSPPTGLLMPATPYRQLSHRPPSEETNTICMQTTSYFKGVPQWGQLIGNAWHQATLLFASGLCVPRL